MRHLLALAVLALCACGNYSNDDIAFLDALPDKQALQVNVPQQGGALTQSPASLYSGTVLTAQTIDTGAENIISAIDLIRTLPPTSRGPDSRTWGPFPDSDPRFQDQAVITRSADTFNYQLQQRPLQGQFVTFLSGSFVGATARAGHGTLDLEQDPLDSIGHPSADPNLRSIRFVYSNDTTPRSVNTTIVGRDATNGTNATLTYTYSESAAEGDLDFELSGPSDLGVFDLHLVSRWVPDGGQGRCGGTGTFGSVPGFHLNVDQCWDRAFAETWYDSTYDYDGGNPLVPLHGVGIDCDAGAGLPIICPRGDAGACPF